MSWISHVKDYQKKHPGMSYGEAMQGAKSSWHGRKKGKGLIDKVKQALFFPPNKLPGNSQSVFNRFNDAAITKIMVNRTPVVSAIDRVLNVISLGKYGDAKKDLNYDKMFHLSMVLYTTKGVIGVEKLERINIQVGGTGAGESIDIAYPTRDTLASFMEKARRKMGDHRFFQYNAFENNCQDFIIEANRVLSSEARSFIKQDALTLMNKMPRYVSKIAQLATDTAGKLRQIFTGQGRKKAVSLRR